MLIPSSHGRRCPYADDFFYRDVCSFDEPCSRDTSRTTEGIRPAPQPAPSRPKITGVAGIAVKTKDLTSARTFYSTIIGLDEAFATSNPLGGAGFTTFKINEKQYVYVSADLKDDAESRLWYVSFETSDARGLRSYLASKGVSVPASIDPDPEGNLSFIVKDPEGQDVQFVQFVAGSLHARNAGRFLSSRRLSNEALHVGYRIHDADKMDTFYKDILGFRLMWKGGNAENQFRWISMVVPDGTQWLEYMVDTGTPSPRTLGIWNHLAFGTLDQQTVAAEVKARGYAAAATPKIGRDGRWLMDLYDADLTRVEFMIRKPVQTPCCSPLVDPIDKPGDGGGPVGMFEDHRDVGTPATIGPGSTTYDAATSTYTVRGGGENMWARADHFQFAWKKMSGDVSFSATIKFTATEPGEGTPDQHRKACLLLRQTLDSDALYADAARHGNGMTSLQWRAARGDLSHDVETNVVGPTRLRIDKRGDYVSMFVAEPGQPWRPAGGSTRIPLRGESLHRHRRLFSCDDAHRHGDVLERRDRNTCASDGECESREHGRNDQSQLEGSPRRVRGDPAGSRTVSNLAAGRDGHGRVQERRESGEARGGPSSRCAQHDRAAAS